MDIWITIKVAFKALVKNKMRTFLTMLGIIIGVGSVIAMISIASGAQKDMSSRIESSGTNMLMIFASSGKRRGGISRGWGSIQTLKVDDCEAIMKYCPHVEYASPQIRVTARLIYKNQNWSTAVRAGNEHYVDIRNWGVQSGRSFTSSEVTSGAKVCMIGTVARDNLFGDENPVGKTIRINKIPFLVIGLLEEKGQSGWGGNWDDVVIVPYTTAMQRLYKKDYLTMITVSATDRQDISKAGEEITALLRQRHRIKKGEEDDFVIRTQEERLQAAGEMSKFLSLLLGSIASVSLLVGGIGIMNIMLVSVTERIREIGIRMAVGARQKDIMLQFITEAIVLSIVGGLLGVGLGYGISKLISIFAKWTTVVTIHSIILAMGFSGAIGLFFGFYPAWKASKLDPIEALRTE